MLIEHDDTDCLHTALRPRAGMNTSIDFNDWISAGLCGWMFTEYWGMHIAHGMAGYENER